MKHTGLILSIFTTSLLFSNSSFAQFHAPVMERGLSVKEYPQLESQTENDDSIFVEPNKLGDPTGEPKHIANLTKWTPANDFNSIAKGYLEITEPGTYQFSTESNQDANILRIDGEDVCRFQDGDSKVNSIELQKGRTLIECIAFTDGNNSSQGISVKWKPPGQDKLTPIPDERLFTRNIPVITDQFGTSFLIDFAPPVTQRADQLTIVAKDFIIDIYKDGKRIKHSQRKVLSERAGAMVEQVNTSMAPGSWLVLHVAHNRMHSKTSKYLSVAGTNQAGEVTIVSDPASPHWSSCDFASLSSQFISDRDFGMESRAAVIEEPWAEGAILMDKHLKKTFPGRAIWGTSSSTWIKYVVPEEAEKLPKAEPRPEPADDDADLSDITLNATKVTESMHGLAVSKPDKWTVQILHANYGTGNRNANVTARIKELVEDQKVAFRANPGHLKVDPCPHWNKALSISYIKDGVRRHQRCGENGYFAPELFYGPQDADELENWLLGTRWMGPNGEVQFHPNGVVAGSEVKGEASWRAVASNKLEITWPKAASATQYVCKHDWSDFSVPKDKKNSYRILRKPGSPETFSIERKEIEKSFPGLIY